MTAEFRVLGTLEVAVRGRVMPLPAGKSRVALAGLLLRANEVVSAGQLVRWLWDGAPPNPDRAVKSLHTIMTRLRKSLGEANVVSTVPGGYAAVVRPEQLDLARFRELTASGAHAEALALWRGSGPILTDVVSNSLHQEQIASLIDERLAALELRLESDLERGRHLEIIPELQTLTRQHPLRETFWAHYMLALYRGGQQADALAAYRTVTKLLAEELGSTPSPALRELHQRILVGEVNQGVTRPAARRHPVPRQLPINHSHFVGREDELALLDESASAAVSVISGMAGVGKTTLAVRWAHASAHLFPDGQLYVDLRGFGPRDGPVGTAEALRGFLDALGVPPEQVSTTPDGMSHQFRDLLNGRKMLVLLDNARDAGQISLLLPSTPGCTALVTSRNSLTDLLVGEDVRAVALSTLNYRQAVALLERHLGAERVHAEYSVIEELTALCGGLPLALSVVAARAATTTLSLRALADELTNASLDALSDDDASTDVRVVFSWSYRQLSLAAARLFRLLGMCGGDAIGVQAVTALAGGDARTSLAELVQAQLISSPAPDRYSCHDLLAAYAAELVELDTGREAAHERLLDYYLHCADIADDLLPVSRTPMSISPRHRPLETPSLTTAGEATAWFDAELPNLIAAIESAAAPRTWQLTYTLSRYLWLRADLRTLLRVCHLALPSTEGTAEPRLAILLNIGIAHERLREHEEAVMWLERALDVSGQVSGLARARVLGTLASALEHLGRLDEAEAHHLEATATAQKAGATWIEAITRHNLGAFYKKTQRWDDAEREIQLALPMYDQAGERVGAVSCRVNLAELQFARGAFEAARATARTSLAMSREIGSRYHEAGSLAVIGDTAHVMNTQDAIEHWEEALAIYEEIGAPEANEVRAKLQAVRNV